jgi:predicted molibdopterin-dependent oxidoreductase YjgC
MKNPGLDYRSGQTRMLDRPRRDVFGSPASCLSDSEFLTGWKKCPGTAETTIKAEIPYQRRYGKMIKFNINDTPVEAEPGWTVLETARHYGIEIPTICYHEAVSPNGACRLCMVEIKESNGSRLVASCIYPVADGLRVYTETERVDNVRRWIFEMLLAQCPASKEIKTLARKYGVVSTRFPMGDPDETCMLCGLCTRACEEIIGLSAISIMDRGVHKKVGAPFSKPTEVCVACGCCVTMCPTGAMRTLIESVRKAPGTILSPLAL